MKKLAAAVFPRGPLTVFLATFLVTVVAWAGDRGRDGDHDNGSSGSIVVFDSFAPAPEQGQSVLSEIAKAEISEPTYSGRVAQFGGITDKTDEFTVYARVSRENLPSVLRHGFFKRIGASGLHEGPINASRDPRLISPFIILALRLSRSMVKLPDDNGLGLALSEVTKTGELPNFIIYKSADIGNYASQTRQFYAEGRLGRVGRERIDLLESIRATAYEFQRLDRAAYDYSAPQEETAAIGDFTWDDAVIMAKGIFLEAVQRLKFRPETCSGLLGYPTSHDL